MAMHGVALMNAGYGKYTYPPDRSGDPRVKAYIDHQEQLRLELGKATSPVGTVQRLCVGRTDLDQLSV